MTAAAVPTCRAARKSACASMLFAVALVVLILLTVAAQVTRSRRGIPGTHDAFVRAVLIAAAVVGLVAFTTIPIIVISYRFATNGSKLTTKIFEGFDGNELMLAFVIGGVLALGWAIKEYIDRLRAPEDADEDEEAHTDTARKERLTPRQPTGLPDPQSQSRRIRSQSRPQPVTRRERREQERLFEKEQHP